MPGDFTNGYSGSDLDEIEERRRQSMNPPKYRSGMDPNGIPDEFSDGETFGDPSFGSVWNPADSMFGGGQDSTFGGGAVFGGQPGVFGGPGAGDLGGQGVGSGFSHVYDPGNAINAGMQAQQVMAKSSEEEIFDKVLDAVKLVFKWVKDYISALKNTTTIGLMHTGKAMLGTSLALLVYGLIVKLCIHLTGTTDATFSLLQLVIASGVGLVVGVPLFLSMYKKASGITKLSDPDAYPARTASAEPVMVPEYVDVPVESEPEPVQASAWGNFGEDPWGVSVEPEPVVEPSVDRVSSGFDVKAQPEQMGDADGILNSMADVDSRMMTRSYLYEKVIPFLSNSKPDYMASLPLPENSREFLTYCGFVEQAASMIAPAKGEYPQVLSIRDKLYYTVITLSRPSWLSASKLNTLVEEVLAQRRFNAETDTVDASITAEGMVVGSEVHIKIHKGVTTMVTVRDVFEANKDWVLNPKVGLPVVFGMKASGDPILVDFANIHSLLIAGAPRSGKSWALKAILGQLMMLNGPDEVQFYLCDPKGPISDFYTMHSPHVREFTASEDDVLRIFKTCCNEEAARRASILERVGCRNIDDLRRLHPEIKLPRLYVVIDEIMTFSTSMAPEVRSQFYKLMGAFVSRLPGYGMHLIVVPHIAKNQIIDRTVIDLIPNKVCVRGNEDDIANLLSTTPKSFKHACVNPGDMALHLSGDADAATFARSVLIATSNENYDKFFEFMMNFWVRLMPETVQGSRLETDILSGVLPTSACSQIELDAQFAELVKNAGTRRIVQQAQAQAQAQVAQVGGTAAPARPLRPNSRGSSSGASSVQSGSAGGPRRPRKF